MENWLYSSVKGSAGHLYSDFFFNHFVFTAGAFIWDLLGNSLGAFGTVPMHLGTSNAFGADCNQTKTLIQLNYLQHKVWLNFKKKKKKVIKVF